MKRKRTEPKQYLDERQDAAYSRSSLQGDQWVEYEGAMPAVTLEARKTTRIPNASSADVKTLDGPWYMKGSDPGFPSDVARGQGSPVESQGVLEGWYAPDVDRSDWYRVDVPTTVQAALLKLGEIDDPFWDENTYREITTHGEPKDATTWHFRKTRIEQKDWWFARNFMLPKGWKGRRYRLSFDGIDYAGSIYLNGHSLGHHEGMYGGPTRDVTDLLNYGGKNVLVVRVDKVPDTWHGNMKGSPGWGWHYGHLISTGIWRSVSLEIVPDTELRAPFVRTTQLDENHARLDVQYDVFSHVADDRDIEVFVEIRPRTFQGKTHRFRSKTSVRYGLQRFTTHIELPQPRPWWPMHYGDPDLYDLNLVARDARTRDVLDTVESPFGVRTIEMQPLEDATPEEHYRWQFVVNGVPMFIKGMNWCWSDPLLELDADKYEHLLELTRRAGVQMLRSWGGGIVETDEFYRLCDEKGIMVYQEFSYCWGPPDFPWTNSAVLDQQVTSVVKRYRNHPSLVMWGGGNENVKKSGNDEGLFLVGRRCRQFDPSRPFHRTSPWGGGLHNWRAFHGGEPMDQAFTARPSPFYGEFGVPSMPNYEANLNYLPEEKLAQWPPALDDGGILMHLNMFSMGDIVKVMRYGDYGPIDNWRTFIEYGQVAQGDELAFALRLQRAGSYADRGGLWYYKMTELFPGLSWGVLDFYGNPKLSYFRTRQLYAPRDAWLFAAQLDWKAGQPFQAQLHAANDSGSPLENACVDVVFYDAELNPFWEEQYAIPKLGVSSRRKLADLSIELPRRKVRPFLANVRLFDSEGSMISDQWHWFNYRNKTRLVRKMESYENFRWPSGHDEAWDQVWDAYAQIPEKGLTGLPQTEIEARIEQNRNGGRIVITNPGQRPAFMVIIDHFPSVFGAFLEDNGFSLRPGESRAVTFETPDACFPLKEIRVRAWNAPGVPVE